MLFRSGVQFLGHVERCKVLLHLVDATEITMDVATAYKTVRAEIKAYSGELAKRKEIVALSKCDALTPEVIAEKAAELQKAARKKPLVLSAVSGLGMKEAMFAIAKEIGRKTAAEKDEAKEKVPWTP